MSDQGPTIGIQWKGADVCLDFRCPACGFYQHYCTESPTCSAVKCESCGKLYEMSHDIPITEIGPDHEDWDHYQEYAVGVGDGEFRFRRPRTRDRGMTT